MKNFDEAVNNLINMFKNEDFPQKLALTIIKRVDEGIPSDKWSITNKLIMLLLGNTTDARGYKQWQETGRHIKKGEKAFYILAPNTKKIKNEKDEDEYIITGFRPIPVFRYESTEGKEIPHHDYKPQELPPFLDVAEKMGIKVKWKPIHKNAYGYYRPWDKSITLCSQDYIVYFHELAHAVHDTIEPLKNVDTNKAEIVAELSAAVLTEMLGISGYEQQAYEYIRTYTKGKKDKNVIISITNVLNTVQKVVEKITSISEKEQKTAA